MVATPIAAKNCTGLIEMREHAAMFDIKSGLDPGNEVEDYEKKGFLRTGKEDTLTFYGNLLFPGRIVKDGLFFFLVLLCYEIEIGSWCGVQNVYFFGVRGLFLGNDM